MFGHREHTHSPFTRMSTDGSGPSLSTHPAISALSHRSIQMRIDGARRVYICFYGARRLLLQCKALNADGVRTAVTCSARARWLEWWQKCPFLAGVSAEKQKTPFHP